MQDILINWAPQETRVAIVENGAVQELHVERTLERGLVGNIYAGKVVRVLPGMQSAFGHPLPAHVGLGPRYALDVVRRGFAVARTFDDIRIPAGRFA